MRIEPITPDIALPIAPPAHPDGGAALLFGEILDTAGATLSRADAAESAFTSGTGGLGEMVVERARADITLAAAAAGAQRAAQALNTLLGMQI